MNRRNLFPLAMLLLAAAGALLPTGIAALDNSRLENRVDSRPLPGIHLSLAPEQGVEDTLLIWAEDNMKVELSQGGERSSQEAKAAAEAAIDLLAERELLPPPFSGTKLDSVYPLAVIPGSTTNMAVAGRESDGSYSIKTTVDSEASHAAVVWCGTTPSLQIFIDDATGKLVAMSYEIGKKETVNPAQWAGFLQEYYDLSDLRIGSFEDNQANARYVWELVWEQDGQEITCPFTLFKRGNTVYINYTNM